MSSLDARAVLFDMDGVLVDSYEAWFRLMNAAARDFGYPPISRERFGEIWGQGVDLDVKFFFTRHRVAEVEAHYNRHFTDHADRVRANPEAKGVFEALRKHGLGIAVITNTPSTIAREVLARAGLEPDVLVGGTDVSRPKPAPDMVLRALEILRVPNWEAVFVGDSRFDREAAEAAGVRFVGYGNEGRGSLREALGLE